MSDEDLAREVQELRKALKAMKASFEIVSQMAQAYLRLLNVYAEYGGFKHRRRHPGDKARPDSEGDCKDSLRSEEGQRESDRKGAEGQAR